MKVSGINYRNRNVDFNGILMIYFPVVSNGNTGEMFIWMPKQHLYVLVYLVTVMHSMQAGYMNKAQEYTDKALAQIEKLKGKASFNLVCQFPWS